jgi:hypothetical protein
MSKLHNIKTITPDGIKHDSHKEARRWCELLMMQKAGVIQNLQRQVKYVLIPTQYETVENISKKTGKKLKDKLVVVEKECSYIADFVYKDSKTGYTIVEDTKGYKQGNAYALFTIKRKLMLYVHGIAIVEI